jgi:ATP citrate (pro-S)-lyase
MVKLTRCAVPGIGHRIKSRNNPDLRVELVKEYVLKHFPSHKLLDYAIAVETVTTSKKDNLILNVGSYFSPQLPRHSPNMCRWMHCCLLRRSHAVSCFISRCHGTALLTICRSSGVFSSEEAEDYMKMGVLNGLFVLGRSIGLIAHHLDQKRVSLTPL